ncbi:hypothetical protein A3A60_01050 [Candidatus Curtissbacteria bacterium RIFCSPLOWO2_01_FULL_42_26]|uniref:Uncharacterized protein n=1 Tax=Candidatus Curtissbacteria bacterium RIFCSPLOWO2_01_FULL_42_26 TaxID=1797729 RepID=A0A1F5HY69_9BACT|nr:MAG: hypothetical protein A3A60_01050 [Candidatus Curtissbacteria bacterium RIFCSPLOWO2_01_FULL_42_26]
MDDLLNFLLEPLVSDIKTIKIEKAEQDQNLRYLVTIPKEDIAKVIGKGGKMIKAIKNLLRVRGVKENIFASIEVLEA